MDSKFKRILLIVFLLFTLISGLALYTYLSGEFRWDSVIIVIIIALFLAYAIPKFILDRNDVVEQDEYSKKIMRLAAARSYMISLYTWLALMWFDEPLSEIAPESTTKIGIGIGIMAIVFLVNALVIKARGIRE